MQHPLRIFIGYDPREGEAYRICIRSLIRHLGGTPFEVTPINMRFHRNAYTRPHSRKNGVLWDDVSNAPMSTEFSLARFLVPYLARRGAALYLDCDFMFRANVADLFSLYDSRYVVQCVKHEVEHAEGVKMDGQVQTQYARKNWSSLMLFNAELAEQRLTVNYVNSVRGLELHQMKWCLDEEIGALPAEWNHLVGVSPPAVVVKAAHFTLGTPNMPGHESTGGVLADEWRQYAAG